MNPPISTQERILRAYSEGAATSKDIRERTGAAERTVEAWMRRLSVEGHIERVGTIRRPLTLTLTEQGRNEIERLEKSRTLSNSRRMLALLSEAVSLTCREIADATGIDADTVSNRLLWYVTSGHVDRLNPGERPLQYALTDSGHALIDGEQPAPVSKPLDIADVLSRRPPLDMAWMSVAREHGVAA